MPRIALDAQLLLLLLAGEVGCRLDEGTPKLKQYRYEDYELLVEIVGNAGLVAIPNVLTEVSNLIGQETGFRADQLRCALHVFAVRADECYVPSRVAAARPEFNRLGLTDAAWLCVHEPRTTLWTDDIMLHIAATAIGVDCRNFSHLRVERGHL